METSDLLDELTSSLNTKKALLVDALARWLRDQPVPRQSEILRHSSPRADINGDGGEPVDALARALEDARAAIVNAQAQLSAQRSTPAERMLVVLYYLEAMTMKEVGRVLGLSESRVSQMHSSILARLRATVSAEQLGVVEAD